MSASFCSNSSTFFVKDGEFGVCSRNIHLKPFIAQTGEAPVFWKMAQKDDIEEKMRELDHNLVFQGEITGPGLCGNKLKLNAPQLNLFNIFDIDTRTYYSHDAMMDMFEELDLPTVPVIFEDFTLPTTVPEIVELATRKSVVNPDVQAEGLVFRPQYVDLFQHRLGRVSFKVINPQFLLEHKQ